MSAPLPSELSFPKEGSILGSWLVSEPIGRGSHGVAFRVVNVDRTKPGSYALKLAKEPGDARFEREAWLLSQVNHASVPRLEGSGSWKSPGGETHPYIVMQYVEGLSLYAWAAEHGLTVRQGIEQLAQVTRALEATHQHGLHRDVKGGNIRVSPKGHAVLLDFGSCWYPGATPLTGRALPPGTPPYRSPQLLMLKFALELGSDGTYETQPADDMYALGITAYKLLAGAYPPCDSDGTALPQAPSGLNDVCPELGNLIVRLLSEDPKARGSAKQVARELEQLQESSSSALDEPWVANASQLPTEKAKPPAAPRFKRRELASVAALAGGGLSLTALLGVLLTRDGGQREEAYTEPPPPDPQVSEAPDAGTTLGEEALASVKPDKPVQDSKGKVSRDVPTEPLSTQRRPPCNRRGAVEIKGGCWLPLGAEAGVAPCDTEVYHHQGRCYVPIEKTAERVPTSDDPK